MRYMFLASQIHAYYGRLVHAGPRGRDVTQLSDVVMGCIKISVRCPLSAGVASASGIYSVVYRCSISLADQYSNWMNPRGPHFGI